MKQSRLLLYALVFLSCSGCAAVRRTQPPPWMSWVGRDSVEVTRQAQSLWNEPDSVLDFANIQAQFYHGALIDADHPMHVEVVLRNDSCLLVTGGTIRNRAAGARSIFLDSIRAWMGDEVPTSVLAKGIMRHMVDGSVTSWQTNARTLRLMDFNSPDWTSVEYFPAGSNISDYYFARMLQFEAHQKGDSSVIREVDSLVDADYR